MVKCKHPLDSRVTMVGYTGKPMTVCPLCRCVQHRPIGAPWYVWTPVDLVWENGGWKMDLRPETDR